MSNKPWYWLTLRGPVKDGLKAERKEKAILERSNRISFADGRIPQDYRVSAFYAFNSFQALVKEAGNTPWRLGFRATYRKNLHIVREYRYRLSKKENYFSVKACKYPKK